tara:strand:+ start:1021 stop:1599 length:579 start_codon:yes stop_codon:yes gene_type:complete
MIEKKFDKLFESNFQTLQGGGLLTGDVVKFIDGVLDHAWTKKQQPNLVDRIKEMIDSDNNIRIGSVKSLRPAAAGSVQQDQQVDDFYCDVVSEYAPGLWHSFVTVPMEVLSREDLGMNLAPIPDSQKREDTSHITPKELDHMKGDDETCPVYGTKSDEGDRQLLNTDIKIAKGKPTKDNLNIKVYLEGFEKL